MIGEGLEGRGEGCFGEMDSNVYKVERGEN